MTSPTTTDRVDVLIIGAGISGIGAARYLRTEHPSKSFAIVEARSTSGGTWDLFRYPGIRSDSDLHTFGYAFKPWTDKQAIADAPRILDYLHETIDENELTDRIRYDHKVVSAAWSSDDARWQVEIDRTDTGERVRISAGWIFCGSGYYDYDQGFSPDFAGRERFRGQIVHPQHWPEDLDYAGKRVVVIGSGATAVTLLPAMADDAEHVTMLQRTPTYIIPLPREDAIANTLKKVLGDERGYALTRQKNVAQQRLLFELCQRFPSVARRMIRKINESQLPEGYPVDKHFNPPYNPWDQRLCVVPDSDLFRTIRKGKASIVTDRIASFTENGILLESGEELEADIIVTATGLNIKIIGGIELTVDGHPVSLPDTVVYRGMMLSGIPNFALAIGYTNASWTLKIGLLCEYFCKLLTYMDAHRHDSVWPVADPTMPTRPLLDFGAGYVQRALATLPKQGEKAPWVMSMSYYADRRVLRGDVADENLHFARARDRAAGAVGV
ncbi:NAD(P)/FAD-dependent oxidoreductase [Gordonia sp. ABSL11-1]|uniref:flavin-containing monooxygenase n=1 Tax=Gordonia sp. ABSL11-1 TaxID=3053924 RepID=UPI0025738A91|nr:NAD(P)/FAD-dependent oxidoreductase [Gordonia sp. ABSL11-1]MDL9948441.1 NAD(P)/FAD-dependent oxidoreductase [Gordonia sp. ABSL11-1]